MMSYAGIPTVGCLRSWEINKITFKRTIASVESFHNLDTVSHVTKCYITSHILFRGYEAIK